MFLFEKHLKIFENISVSQLVLSCPKLQVLDLSNSSLDDEMAEILSCIVRLVRRGDLVKIVVCRDDDDHFQNPVFKNNLILLDLRNTKVRFRGFSALQDCFRSSITILK